AAPILKELGLPATFFVCSGTLDLSPEKEWEFMQSRLKKLRKITGTLATSELKQLAACGFTIGGHTVSHVNLETVRDSAERKRQVVDDKRKLELILGREIEYFSYPYGATHNQQVDLRE